MALIADVVDDPTDPTPLLVLADYLTDFGPGPVCPGELPRWLQRAWLRSRRGEDLGPYGGFDAEGMILLDMEDWFRTHARPRVWSLDHPGKVLACGLECFVSEPRVPLAVAQAQARLLAAKARCVGVALPEGASGKDAKRVLLLPSPKQMPKRMRPR